MTITPEMIEAAAKTMDSSWYEEDACHCHECAATHQEVLDSAKAALTAALAAHFAGLERTYGADARKLAESFFMPDQPKP